MRRSFFGVPIIWILVYWGPLFLETSERPRYRRGRLANHMASATHCVQRLSEAGLPLQSSLATSRGNLRFRPAQLRIPDDYSMLASAVRRHSCLIRV